MLRTEQIDELLRGSGDVIGNDDEKIGSIGHVFLDDTSGEPEWVTVRTGLFGRSETFIPLRDARVQGEDLRVPYDKDTVKDAPRVDEEEGHLSADEEARLYRFYAVHSPDGSDERDDEDDGSGDENAGMGARDSDRRATAETREPGSPEPDLSSGRTTRMRRYVYTERVIELPGEDDAVIDDRPAEWRSGP